MNFQDGFHEMGLVDDVQICEIHSYVVPISGKTTWIFLSLETSDGLIGFGECTLAGMEEAVLAEIGNASQLLTGSSFKGPNAILKVMSVSDMFLPRRVVCSALEQAALDCIAQRAGTSIATVLGGALQERVRVYANINRGIANRTPDGFAAQARIVQSEEGYSAYKIAPFDGLHWSKHGDSDMDAMFRDGIDRIAAVRQAIGDKALLLVDCHNRLSPIMAAQLAKAAADLDVYWLEDVLDDAVFDQSVKCSFRSLANNLGVRVAGGEQLMTLSQAKTFFSQSSVDVILPDIRYTGVRGAMNILELATSFGLESSIHNPAGPILDLVSLHAASALNSFSILERQVRESPLFVSLLAGGLQVDSGRIHLPSGAGAGISPDRRLLGELAKSEIARVSSFSGVAGAGADS